MTAPVPRQARQGKGSCNSLHEPVQLDENRVDFVGLTQAMPAIFDESKLDIG